VRLHGITRLSQCARIADLVPLRVGPTSTADRTQVGGFCVRRVDSQTLLMAAEALGPGAGPLASSATAGGEAG